MARVKLELAEQFFYSTSMEVRYTDLNTSQHVGNDQMIALLSAARYKFLKNMGIDARDVEGKMLVVTDLVTSYVAESYIGDTLTIEMGFMDFNKYGADIIFRVSKNEGKDIVALAKTGFVFIDGNGGSVTLLPESFKIAIPDKYRPS